MKEKLVECSFLIPEVGDSDRRVHRGSAWQELAVQLREAFPSGHTGPEIVHRDVRSIGGEYSEFDTDRIVRDISRRYTVAIPEGRVVDLRRLLSWAAEIFDQKAIYLSVAGIVEFVTSGPSSGPGHWGGGTS